MVASYGLKSWKSLRVSCKGIVATDLKSVLLRVEAGDGALFISTVSEEVHRTYVLCTILREWKTGYTWSQVVEVRKGELGIKGSTMATHSAGSKTANLGLCAFVMPRKI